MRIKDLLRLNYESQIRISLVSFILFLILFNFGTEYLFHQTKRALRHQAEQSLSTVARSACLVWEKSSQSALKKNLVELSLESEVNRISFLSSDGEPLISSREFGSSNDLHIFRGVKPELVALFRAEGQERKLGKFFSDFYTDSSGGSYLSCYFPLESQKVKNPIWVVVEKDVSAFANIEKASKLNVLARIAGLLIAALVTVLLIRNLLQPYQLMIKKATKEKIIPSSKTSKKEGKLDDAVGIFEQVIRELKQKEKQLKELYKKTDRKARDLASYNEYILKSMTSGMIICDEEGKITRMNQPAEKILGFVENSILGENYETILAPKNPVRSAIHRAFAEKRACSIPEINMTRKDRENLPLSVNSSAVKDEQGRMLGVVAFFTDLTELKKLEEQVAFKDKMATLGEMFSGLAHELRNSMGAILGFSKLLKKIKDDPFLQGQAIQGIVKEAISMEAMLQRFLEFTKPLQLKIEKFDLTEIIRECHTPLRESLREKNITFELKSEPNLFSISGDRLLLRQCFQNLIQNSIEAMPQGGKLNIGIGEKRVESGEKYAVVEVSDTGCRIAKEDQDKIFNPFFTSKEKGIGLGLSLVKKFVTLHDGKIEVESDLNRGTIFKIYLPLKLKPEIAQTESEQTEDMEALTCVSS